MNSEFPPPLMVVIVGSGFAGIGMAIKLRQAGVNDFMILERAEGVGGTWRDNTYPGAGCDIPSPLYSFSFEPDFDWPRLFSAQADILRYQQHLVEKYRLKSQIRLNCEVKQANFDQTTALWTVQTSQGDLIRARVLVSATGQLNRPAYPKIPGLEAFQGQMFHSARWNHNYDLTGKRVGIIGTGASAIQFIPTVVAQADQVVLFQRTPPYILPKSDRAFTGRDRWLHHTFPVIRSLLRWRIYGSLELFGLAILKFRPLAAIVKEICLAHLWLRVRDPELRRKLTPTYPLGCKRFLVDSKFYPAVSQPNVQLVTAGIIQVGADDVQTDDGAKHRLDALIFGTGFAAQDFIAPMQIYGLKGQELNAVWREGASAYLGISVSSFPNFFMLYGPNTNLGHNSIIVMLESQIHYIMGAIATLQRSPDAFLDLKSEVQQRFNDRLQQSLHQTVWSGDCSSWYKNPNGKITNNWPGLATTYRNLTRNFDQQNYQLKLARSCLPSNILHDNVKFTI
ncbi:MAG: NAD(P)/FAD-dependent oxidoreductase [Aphanocapsa sp. GSE-SYN-MK-11-07L]|jgi:cation diffusion facilitator CzcD-associated flavoprotein CzcO|nr:NAD(P)/FAD-dependent oxidoreductase [Aphanocapsa sp. GSE-SYN-MK-11-07L]